MVVRASRESVWHRWSALTPARRLLVVRAGLWLPVFSLAVQLVALRRILSVLGLRRATIDDTPATGNIDRADRARAMDVARAISAVAGRLPWTSTCLAQALTGARLLHGSAVPATITLGVARGLPDGPGSDAVVAHAWLDHGAVSVTGGAEQGRFLPVGRFVG